MDNIKTQKQTRTKMLNGNIANDTDNYNGLCNLNFDNIGIPVISQDNYDNVKQRVIIKITNYLKRTDLHAITYKDLSKTSDYIFYLDYNRSMLFCLDKKHLSEWIMVKYHTNSHEYRDFLGIRFIISRRVFKSEGIFDAFNGMISSLKNTMSFFIKTYQHMSNPHMIAWVLDNLTLLMELNDPYFWRPINLIKFLVRFYSSAMRFTSFKNSFKSQSLDDSNILDTLMLAITCFGLPDVLLAKIKQISLFTNKKILDSPNILMDIIEKFLEILLDLLNYIKTTVNLPYIDLFIEYISKPFSFVKSFTTVKKMSNLVIRYHKNAQILFEPQFREEAKDIDKELRINAYFQGLLGNPSYKAVQLHYKTFEEIIKLSNNFTTSSRAEPVCIVLEGKAGTYKSTFLNKLIDYLSSKNMTVYTHTCAAVDAGKDFYDDYLNQDIFVMDDVGQQGVSQWRQIINFVSPVKFPLDCAAAEKKNTKTFNSKMLIVTTNHFSDLKNFTKSDCISEPEALFRRCHVLNFDDVRSVKGSLEGDIIYKKYDYKNSVWKKDFIAPFDSIRLPLLISSSDSNMAVAWMYALVKKLLEIQENLFVANTLTDVDLLEISTYADIFETPAKDLPKTDNPFSDLTKDFVSQGLYDLSFINAFNYQFFQEYFSGFLDTVSNVANSIITKISDTFSDNTIKLIFCAAASLMTLYIAKIIRTAYFPKTSDDGVYITAQTYIETSIDEWRDAVQKFKERNIRIKTNGQNYTWDQFSEGAMSVTHAVQDRMRVISLTSDDGYVNMSQTIISGRRAIVQSHSFSSKGVANVYRNWAAAQNNICELNNVPYTIIKDYPHMDLAVIEFDLTIGPYKDSSDLLFPSHPGNANRRRNILSLVSCDFILPLTNNFCVNKESFIIQTMKILRGQKDIKVPAGAGIHYPLSADGLCGTLVIDAFYGLSGIHIAGNGSDGFAMMYSADVLQELKDLLKNKNPINLEFKKIEDPDFSGIKLFNDKYQSKMPLSQTNLVESELFNELEDLAIDLGEKVPPNLQAFGNKTLEVMAAKSFKTIPTIPNDEIEFGKKCIEQFFIEFDDLTDAEVIHGNDDLASMNKDSVNGFGYNREKEDYIDIATGTMTPEFRDKVDGFIDRCENDRLQPEDLLFYEALKDELRPIEKANKPRSFRVAPLHHTFLVKKFLGKLFVHCRKNMWFNQIAVGINPYRDWDKLYKHLKLCFILFDGDVGNWDGGTAAQVQDAISQVCLKFYKGKNGKTLAKLLCSMIRTYVLIKEKIALTTHSMPSGCWVTAFFNSLYNRFITAMVLYREMKKDGKTATVADFLNLTDFVLGDDKLCGAPENLSKYFNAFTVKNYFNSLGMKYTDGEKGEITSPSKPIHDLCFLKRSFRFHHKLEKVVGPLALGTLVNSLRYFDSARDYDEVMKGKMTAFQFEIYLHENEQLKAKILNAALNCDFPLTEFSDHHIMKTMHEPETYAFIMNQLGKNIKTYL